MPKALDLTGERFARLLVVERVDTGKPRTWWKCKCDCGKECIASAEILRSGDKQSCGCLLSEGCRDRFTKHGHSRTGPSGDLPSPEYYSYRTMKGRCLNPNASKYDHYGGRGITICDRWLHSFENFLADMGPRPHKYTIERIDGDGNYEPSNCRWATRKEQSRNTKQNRNYEYQGRTQCLMDWAIETGIDWHTLHYRLKRNWTVEKAFSTPLPERVPPPAGIDQPTTVFLKEAT